MSKRIKLRRWDDIDEAARELYEAYAFTLRASGGPNLQIPLWQDLPPRMRGAWAAGVRVILAKAHRIIVEDMQAELDKSVRDNCQNLGIEYE